MVYFRSVKYIIINQREYPIEKLSVSGRTSSARIKDGKIVIRLSRFVHESKRNQMIEDFLKWAKKRLSKVSLPTFPTTTYADGCTINTHNKTYTLRIFIENRTKTGISMKDELICIRIAANTPQIKEKIRFLTEKLIMEDQISYLKEVVDELNELYFKSKYKNCRFKRMKTRFGSCSSKGNLNFAFRLLFTPREVFRYVCVHELAHLVQFNHSKRFWNLVQSAMPEYKDAEKWLKNNGFLLG